MYESLLGAYPSPKDARDYSLLAQLTPDQREAPLPESFTAWPIPLVLQQKGGTCVGFSGTYMRLAQQRRDLGVWLHLDPYDLYNEARKRDGLNDSLGEGSTVRGAMKALRAVGQKTTDGAAAPWKNKIANYYAVEPTYDALRRAIYSFGGIVIATPWYNSWFKPGPKGILPKPDREEGGHAIYAIGYDPRGIKLLNSWSRAWGSNGTCFLPPQYVPEIWEAWKALDIPRQ